MVAIHDQAPPKPKRPQPNLCLHCGGQKVERKEVQLVPTPRSTETWTPIAHLELVTQVERTLKSNGLFVGTQAHSLSHNGNRYFGLMEILREETAEDYCWVLGLRNSHDKTFPAGIVAGSQVFCCDNLSFTGEVKLARKHTTHIARDLPRLVQSAVGRLMDRWHHQDTRLATYKVTEIADRTAHDLIVRAVDVGVCPNKLVPRVLHEWREPFHEAFARRNAWSLFNAFTEALKGNLIELPRRTEALHGLLDTHVGLDGPSLT
jgi:hemin uptake protein HemP